MRSSAAPRIAHDAQVMVEGAARAPFEARAVNLSVGGLFVESPTLLPPGTEVTLKVDLRDGSAAVESRAEVVWVREGEAPGMALRFRELDETSTRRIGRVVAAGRREPSAIFKRDVRIRLEALPAPLRAVAREETEEGLVLEAELPWLRLGCAITTELGPGQARSGRVSWVGLDVTRTGAARLRILVELADEERHPVSIAAAPVAALAVGPTAPAPASLAPAPAEATSQIERPGKRRFLRTLALALILVAPGALALWLVSRPKPIPAMLPASPVAPVVTTTRPPELRAVPKEQPAPKPAPPPRRHRHHHR